MPPSRLAALATRGLIAPTLSNTKAGSLSLSRVPFYGSTFDMISPALPTAWLVKSWKSSGDDGRMDVRAMACSFGPGCHYVSLQTLCGGIRSSTSLSKEG